MLRHPGKTTLVLAIAIILSYSFGCILSPEEEIRPDDNPTIVFKDQTNPENLIENMVNSYAAKDREEYIKLLLKTEDGEYAEEYLFHYQEGDAGAYGEDYIDRESEIDLTTNIFNAASGQPKEGHGLIDKLELKIFDGSWDTIDTMWSEYHPGVKYTKRQYYVSIIVDGDTIYGDDYVEFYLVPIQEGDVTTYRIAAIYDVMY